MTHKHDPDERRHLQSLGAAYTYRRLVTMPVLKHRKLQEQILRNHPEWAEKLREIEQDLEEAIKYGNSHTRRMVKEMRYQIGDAVYTDQQGITHHAVGDRAVEHDPGTLLLWPACGKFDIPAGKAIDCQKSKEYPPVDCDDCLNVAKDSFQQWLDRNGE